MTNPVSTKRFFKHARVTFFRDRGDNSEENEWTKSPYVITDVFLMRACPVNRQGITLDTPWSQDGSMRGDFEHWILNRHWIEITEQEAMELLDKYWYFSNDGL